MLDFQACSDCGIGRRASGGGKLQFVTSATCSIYSGHRLYSGLLHLHRSPKTPCNTPMGKRAEKNKPKEPAPSPAFRAIRVTCITKKAVVGMLEYQE